MDIELIKLAEKELPNMPPEAQQRVGKLIAEARKQLTKQAAPKDFMAYVNYVWPSFIHGRHHAKMAAAFERVARGECKRLIINMAPRHALTLGTEIPTTSGWKTIQDIRSGDYVFSPSGSPVKVLSKSEVYDGDLYEVEADDGSKIQCDSNHLWTVKLHKPGIHTYTTEQLYRRQCGELLYTKRNGEVAFRGMVDPNNFRAPHIPVNKAVKYQEKKLLVDPYLLGLWLGDGTNHCGIITSHDDDQVFIRSEIERRGYKTTDQATKMTFGVLGLKVQLRALCVLRDKHIPEQYLIGSIPQRMDLLKGLMDSDGNVSKEGQCFFSQKSKLFINQVHELLNSLGIKNYIQTSEAKIGDKSYGNTYRISFYKKDCCFLPRKNGRTKDQKCFLSRTIKINKLQETKKVQCIKIDNEDGLFLVGRGYCTTHNSKSEFASYLLPAWFLGLFPNKKIIQCSNKSELAETFGRKVRNLVDSEPYKDIFPDTSLQSDSKAAGRWGTNKGGEYYAVGVTATLTGRGGDIVIIDDPHSEQEATLAENNPEIYDKVYEWYTSGPRQRLQPGGAIIIVMTRWSKRDLTGQILKAAAQRSGEDWEVIEFPALLPSGKPLWPEFWPLKELEALHNELPNAKWMAQYQQSPTSENAAIIKREWWQQWPDDTPPPCEFIIQSWDTAFEKTQRSDYSACTTWGVFYHPDKSGINQANIILLNAFKKRMEFPELKKRAFEEWKEWQPDSIIIEAKASGAPLIQELRSMGIPVQGFTPTRGNDKIARLNAVADIFASGMVWVPNTAWAEEVMEEVASFPASDHDDFVDSTSQAISRYRQGGYLRLPSDEADEIKYFKSRKREYY